MRRRGAAAAVIVAGLLAACSHSHKQAATPAAAPAVFPLTGLPTGGNMIATRPALSIKIDNIAAAHPQSGLDRADLVSEQLVEGGLTRLLATYQSADAPTVGPIRSARPVDAGLLRQLGGGIFAFSGGAAGDLAPVRAGSRAVLISNDAGGPFTRSATRAAPDNLYASTTRLYAAGFAAKAPHTPPPALFRYGTAAPTARPTTTATLRFSAASTRSWEWDGRRWLRSENGLADTLDGGARVGTTNVVVLSVTSRDIPGLVDAAGNHGQDITLTGSGQAWVLRGGTVTAGTWTRSGFADAGRLTDATGAPLPLAPGPTWIELLPRPNQPQFQPNPAAAGG